MANLKRQQDRAVRQMKGLVVIFDSSSDDGNDNSSTSDDSDDTGHAPPATVRAKARQGSDETLLSSSLISSYLYSS